MNFFKKLFQKKSDTNSNSEKTFTDTWNDLGVFQYDQDGFAIKYEDFQSTIKWSDITQINVFKTDLLTIDRIDMEIVCGDYCLKINEELSGWYQFVLKTKEIFPTIPKDWDINIIQHAFATNYSTIYDKAKAVDV